MNDVQLIERLGGTDAYAAEVPLPNEIWSHAIALQEIERRTVMQTQERKTRSSGDPSTPRPVRRWLVPALTAGAAVIVAVVIAVVTFSSDQSPASLTPLEVGEALNQAAITGDPIAAGQLYADDATFTGFALADLKRDEPLKEPLEFPDPKHVDWDGDGLITLLDVEIAWMMDAYAADTTTYQSCAEVDSTTVRCQLVYEGYGFLDEPVDQWNIFRVEDGLVVHQEFGFNSADGLFEGPQRRNYHEWVRANRPELEEDLFRFFGSLIITPDTLETHHELVAEWRAQG